MTPTNAPARVAPLTAKRESSPVDVAERSTTSSRDISREFIKPLLKSHRGLPRPPFDCVALVLQGGGALGAFQAGVYQVLAEANLHPDWVAGISIGAINCALIAGNAPEARLEKLRAFWEQVTTQLVFDPFGIADYWLRGDMGHVVLNRLRAGATMLEGAPGFFKPRFPPPYLAAPSTVEAISWYDTTPLRSTLERLVDFDRINSGEMRFSVGAVNIRSGNFVYFDSTTHKIRPEHIMASAGQHRSLQTNPVRPNGPRESFGKDSNQNPRIGRGQIASERRGPQRLSDRAPDLPLEELRSPIQGLRVFPHQHDRPLERRVQRRGAHVAPSGSAAAAAE